MTITTEYTGDHVLLRALLVEAEEEPTQGKLVKLTTGDGWKKYDNDNRLISISVRLWDNSDFSELADIFVEELSKEAGLDKTDIILDKLHQMAERLSVFVDWI